MYAPLALIGFLDGFVHHSNHDRRDINAGAIALDEWNDWIDGHIQCLVSIDRDFFALRWNLNVQVHEVCLR